MNCVLFFQISPLFSSAFFSRKSFTPCLPFIFVDTAWVWIVMIFHHKILITSCLISYFWIPILPKATYKIVQWLPITYITLSFLLFILLLTKNIFTSSPSLLLSLIHRHLIWKRNNICKYILIVNTLICNISF